MDLVHHTWLKLLASPVRVNVLFSLGALGSGSAADVAAHCHASERAVKRHLDSLVALGVAHELREENDNGERRGRPPTVFVLDSAVRGNARALRELLSQPPVPSLRSGPGTARGR